jgi:hypothetical protein
VKIVLIEAYYSIGIVEHYYGLIRRAYLIIIAKVKGITKEIVLQIAFKALNNTTGISGIVPILLVYGILPRLTKYDPLSPLVS